MIPSLTRIFSTSAVTITLPVAKLYNFTGSANLVAHDQARARNLRARGNARLGRPNLAPQVASVPSQNQLFQYVVNVSLSRTHSLLVDTGSSNTWVGAGQTYVQTSTTRQTRDSVAVTYGIGSFSGHECTDLVNLGRGLRIAGQSIGAATTQQGFDGLDGILGVGPSGLTLGTLSPDVSSSIPTGVIPATLLSVSFQPTQTDNIINGELTFGGTDSSKFVDAINFVPITSTAPSSQFFGIDESIRYGASNTILSTTAGIVDTGTTLLLIATDAFQKYQNATGAVKDNVTGLLRITPAQFQNLQSLFFTIGGVVFEFTANAQIWPRALNAAIGGDPNAIFLIVGDIGTPSGSGLDVISGMTFIERFYTVFDIDNNRVGIANTPFTRATTN
ncbi:aspartic proteinase from Irpex Lacteus [Trametes elegans]|nr:aspartic proteinase from Irpex Lacteus [Trametes elegans]